jgi:hypothetical protein
MSDIQCGVGGRKESGRRKGIKKRIAYGDESHGVEPREVAEDKKKPERPKGCCE